LIAIVWRREYEGERKGESKERGDILLIFLFYPLTS